MISRRTIFTFVVMLLIPLGLRAWTATHIDNCERVIAPGRTLPTSVYVESGTRTVEVPCSEWLPRQPLWVQLLCLVELAIAMVFLLSVWRDRMQRKGRNVGRRRQLW